MGKDPAFLFYPDDWVGGTHYLTLKERGAYITLLAAQFNHGALSESLIRRILKDDFEEIWDGLKEKFQKNTKGEYFNQRLKEEAQKRKAYSDSRRKNRLNKTKSKKPDIEKNISMDNDNHKGNENRIGNEILVGKDGISIKSKKPSQKEIEGYLKSRNWKNPRHWAEKILAFAEESGWKRSKGALPIKDWKKWIISTWEKEENIIPTQLINEEQILKNHGA